MELHRTTAGARPADPAPLLTTQKGAAPCSLRVRVACVRVYGNTGNHTSYEILTLHTSYVRYWRGLACSGRFALLRHPTPYLSQPSSPGCQGHYLRCGWSLRTMVYECSAFQCEHWLTGLMFNVCPIKAR